LATGGEEATLGTRKDIMRRLVVFSILLLAAACSKLSTPTEPILGSGTLTATAVDVGSNAGIAGVAVEVRRADTDPLVATLTTDASGAAQVVVPAGAYRLRIVPPNGFAVRAVANSEVMIVSGGTAGITVILSKT
jgi:hypothetical protein